MLEDKKEIGRLFSKKFETFEVKATNTDWKRLSSRLNRLNFFRFSFATFNIYYLTIIIVFAGTATYTTINYNNLSRELNLLEKEIETNQDYVNETHNITENPIIKEDSSPTPSKEITKMENPHFQEHSINRPSPVQEPVKSETMIEESDSSKATVPVVSDTAKHNIKHVKRIISVKPAAVIIKDTVIVRK